MTTILLGLAREAWSDEVETSVRRVAPGARVVVTGDREEMEAVLEEIEIAAGGFPHDLIARAPKLRWYQQWGAGADWLMRYPEVVEKDFVLTNVSGVGAVPISEHIIAVLLAFARRLPEAVRAQARGQWVSQPIDAVFELAGRTMLVVGVGAVGERTARLAAGLEMRVVGVRRHPEIEADGVATMVGPDRLHDFLPQVDFVVLTVPLTHQTAHLIGQRELELMKPSAYLVNVGRGGIIDQDALICALRDGLIAGAALDVSEPEPLPEDSPLWSMDNVIITGHYSGATPVYVQRALDIFLDNLRRYQAGEPLRNVVDKRGGY